MSFKEFSSSHGLVDYIVYYDTSDHQMSVEITEHEKSLSTYLDGTPMDNIVKTKTIEPEFVFNILDLWYYAIYGTFSETPMKYHLFEIAKQCDLLHCEVTDVTPTARSEIITSLIVQISAYVQLSKFGVVNITINGLSFDFEGLYKKDNIISASDEIMYSNGVIIFYVNGKCHAFHEDKIESFSIDMYNELTSIYGMRRYYEIIPFEDDDDCSAYTVE